MAVLKPRNRMVSLRLSEDEYRHLSDLCVRRDAHSTSDLARIAICEYLRRHKLDADRRGLSETPLEDKVVQLEEEVRRLSRLLDGRAVSVRV